MCNACGFLCCAYDGFSKCGCDDCPNPACWDEWDEWDDDEDDDGFYCVETASPTGGQLGPGLPPETPSRIT